MNTFNWNTDCQLNEQFTYREEIVKSIQRILSFYTGTHSAILIVRFDIRYPATYPLIESNKHISLCMSKVIRKYQRRGYHPAYCWVMEQKASIHPHYHCFMLLDASLGYDFHHVFKTVKQFWGSTLGVETHGCIYHCTGDIASEAFQANGYLLFTDNPDYPRQCQEVFNWLSYLAKTQQKFPENDGLRNIGMTRVP